VKLLFDQNLSPVLVKLLADLYPDSNHVYKLGIDRNSDEELRDYARRENFVIVTKDSDFSDSASCMAFPRRSSGYVEEIAAPLLSKTFFGTIARISRLWTAMRLSVFSRYFESGEFQ
jgi:hypothetical protein